MTLEEIERELAKLRYQVRLLGHTVDPERRPIESLILEFDWEEGQLTKAHDIFEEYDNKLNNGQDINWHEFEHKLRGEFDIGYQEVKSIITAFYQNHQWTAVCEGYAKSFEPAVPVEFHRIVQSDD
jgi:hypothetical protein